jgi:hypothetical protein
VCQERSKLLSDVANNQGDREGMHLMNSLQFQLDTQISKLNDIRTARTASLEKLMPHGTQQLTS